MSQRRPRSTGRLLRLLMAVVLLFAGASRVTMALAADPALTITPPSVTVAPHGTQSFTATGGSGAGYTWSLTASPSGGSITDAGVYSAGAMPNVVDTVQATDSDLNVATASVTVTGGVSIVPASVALSACTTQMFTASGGSAPYTWTLLTDGSGTGASVTAAGLYTAGGSAGTDTVQATDSVGNKATATVKVTVVATGPVGAACTTSDSCVPDASGNRYCVDGVCCNTACTGQCQACNTANAVGTCVTIAGPPVGTRPACAIKDSSNVCTTMTCDGNDPNACDVFVGSSVTCGVASCVDSIGTPGAICQGDGGCLPVSPQPCGTYACVSEACATSCTNTSECSPGNYCDVTTGHCLNPTADGGVGLAAGPSGGAGSGCAISTAPSESFGGAALAWLVGVAIRRGRRRARGVRP